jgi:hypothetical protein
MNRNRKLRRQREKYDLVGRAERNRHVTSSLPNDAYVVANQTFRKSVFTPSCAFQITETPGQRFAFILLKLCIDDYGYA